MTEKPSSTRNTNYLSCNLLGFIPLKNPCDIVFFSSSSRFCLFLLISCPPCRGVFSFDSYTNRISTRLFRFHRNPLTMDVTRLPVQAKTKQQIAIVPRDFNASTIRTRHRFSQSSLIILILRRPLL